MIRNRGFIYRKLFDQILNGKLKEVGMRSNFKRQTKRGGNENLNGSLFGMTCLW